jgi:tetratricopeptide (TPR) repeat protein
MSNTLAMKPARAIHFDLRPFACWISLTIACAAAHAQDIPGYPTNIDAYDPREVAMLPPYCPYTQLFRDKVPAGKNADEVARWQAVLGATYQHMHHYCWGLMKTHRGVILAREQRVRQFYLQSAIEEFDYVIERAPAEFLLMPEILTKKGENLVRLGKGPIAVFQFERAAELKPDYWPPYAQMSDYYKGVGDSKKAREVLEQGLSFSPEAPALKRRLAELERGKGPARASP